ncbi:hypothetical protein FB468_2133 [Leucobacter komagatae]|uniref:Uncharacterized protein n=1 Tax=Leucobacter komagatae TaxID=55969 RepID=A0A542Y7M1_9MICO|nr:hypothetical protein FB468_2133 [Leucobacter komagatae]
MGAGCERIADKAARIVESSTGEPATVMRDRLWAGDGKHGDECRAAVQTTVAAGDKQSVDAERELFVAFSSMRALGYATVKISVHYGERREVVSITRER